MSTTFHVIPTRIETGLTFHHVMTLAEQTIYIFLQRLFIDTSVRLSATIHDQKETYARKADPGAFFWWKKNEYAWFMADGIKGGTDAYCTPIAENLSGCDTYLEDTLAPISVSGQLKQQIIECGCEWHFRRSAAQEPLINIAYGHLAAALARLTNGYIYTHDGAWHDDIFPATADQLLDVYFYPDKAKDAADYDWAIRNIEWLRKELAGP